MKYYYERYGSDDSCCLGIFIRIIIMFAIVVGLMYCVNFSSESIWNDDQCVNCEIKYELRGASNGLKYYVCPDCGQEVERY